MILCLESTKGKWIDMFQFKISKFTFTKWIIGGIFFFSVVHGSALADNIRPVYLEIEELASGNIRVVWKVPRGQGLPPQFEPSFPEKFRIIPPRKRLKTNDAIVETWYMTGGDEGLAGTQIQIDGLKQTTTDALVRIRLSDGSVHRVVLRPAETSTTIPNPHKTNDKQKKLHTSLLQFIDHWRYGLLLSTALVLSLLSMRSAKGNYVLCTIALIAGALCGHALGRMPAYDKFY